MPRFSQCSQVPVAILVLVLFTIGGVMAAEEIKVGRLSALDPGESPGGWSPLSFPKAPGQTRYALTEEDGRVVVRAHSQVSASALLRKINVDPSQHPYLHWSWKTDESCFAGDWREPATDDFPLRLFVLFEAPVDSSRSSRSLDPTFPVTRSSISAVRTAWTARSSRFTTFRTTAPLT